MKTALRLAAIYNVAWGLWVVCFPWQWWDWLGMARPNYPQIWQCLGMVIGVYGIGYWIAARDPSRHWVIVLVGFLGKVLGPIGAVIGVMQGALPWKFCAMNFTNDVVWWVPFGMILWRVWRSGGERNK